MNRFIFKLTMFKNKKPKVICFLTNFLENWIFLKEIAKLCYYFLITINVK